MNMEHAKNTSPESSASAGQSLSSIVEQAREIFEDLQFTRARAWKDAVPGRKVIGYMPIYVPREIIHAAGMLPLGIFGGGDGLEVIHGDAYYQSYICRIPRSTIELGVTGRLDFVDGMLFPSICDVIRNLSGMWKVMFPQVYVRYFDVPQNYRSEIGGTYYAGELRELLEGLERLGGVKVSEEDLRASVALFNENRRAIRDLYDLRSAQPNLAPSSEVYLIMRAGCVLPVNEHTELVRAYIDAAKANPRPLRDNARVILTGAFCEQPPLNLIKSIELSGCYVVDDDFMLVSRWITEDVPLVGDPIENLAQAFLSHSVANAAKYEARREDKGRYLVSLSGKRRAQGVIFASPSFCDPSLLDRPMLQDALNHAKIAHTAFKYAENSGQMQPIREQAGTFADSIKLWGEA
jgi:benzoyl-CoA reductase subunit C